MLRVVASRGRSGMRLGDVVSGERPADLHLLPHAAAARDRGAGRAPPGDAQVLPRARCCTSSACSLGRAINWRCAASRRWPKLAEQTQDTVYLSERRGLEAVCTARALGDYPIKALTLDVGIRRPLGVGAGGLAILCALPEAEADEIIEANASRYAQAVEPGRRSRASGNARRASAGLRLPRTARWCRAPQPWESRSRPTTRSRRLSVAAISTRLDESRRLQVAAQLQHQARRLTRSLAGEGAATSP